MKILGEISSSIPHLNFGEDHPPLSPPKSPPLDKISIFHQSNFNELQVHLFDRVHPGNSLRAYVRRIPDEKKISLTNGRSLIHIFQRNKNM